MNPKNLKFVIAAAYMVVVAGGAIASGVTSSAALVAFAAVALLPAGALVVLWNDPVPTLSATIRAPRR